MFNRPRESAESNEKFDVSKMDPYKYELITNQNPLEIVEEIMTLSAEEDIEDDFDEVDVDVEASGDEDSKTKAEEETAEASDSSEDEDSEDDVFKCKHCDEDFDEEDELLEHITENHPFDCPMCRRPYKVSHQRSFKEGFS